MDPAELLDFLNDSAHSNTSMTSTGTVDLIGAVEDCFKSMQDSPSNVDLSVASSKAAPHDGRRATLDAEAFDDMLNESTTMSRLSNSSESNGLAEAADFVSPAASVLSKKSARSSTGKSSSKASTKSTSKSSSKKAANKEKLTPARRMTLDALDFAGILDDSSAVATTPSQLSPLQDDSASGMGFDMSSASGGERRQTIDAGAFDSILNDLDQSTASAASKPSKTADASVMLDELADCPSPSTPASSKRTKSSSKGKRTPTRRETLDAMVFAGILNESELSGASAANTSTGTIALLGDVDKCLGADDLSALDITEQSQQPSARDSLSVALTSGTDFDLSDSVNSRRQTVDVADLAGLADDLEDSAISISIKASETSKASSVRSKASKKSVSSVASMDNSVDMFSPAPSAKGRKGRKSLSASKTSGKAKASSSPNRRQTIDAEDLASIMNGLDDSMASNASMGTIALLEDVEQCLQEDVSMDGTLDVSVGSPGTVDLLHDVMHALDEDDTRNRRKSTLSDISVLSEGSDVFLDEPSFQQSNKKRSALSMRSPLRMNKKPLVIASPEQQVHAPVMPPSALKSCMSARKTRPDLNRSVAFGSPEVAEFRKTSPITSYTPLGREEAKQMFLIPSDDLTASTVEEDEITDDNERVLEEWDRLTNTSETGSPEQEQEQEQEWDELFHEQESEGCVSMDSIAGDKRKTRRRRSKIQPVLDISEDGRLGEHEVSSIFESEEVTCTVDLPANLLDLVNEVQQGARQQPMALDASTMSLSAMDHTEELEVDLATLVERVTARHTFDASMESGSSGSPMAISANSSRDDSGLMLSQRLSMIPGTVSFMSDDSDQALPNLLNMTCQDIQAMESRLAVPSAEEVHEEVEGEQEEEGEYDMASELQIFMMSPKARTPAAAEEEEVEEMPSAIDSTHSSLDDDHLADLHSMSFIQAKRKLLLAPSTPRNAFVPPPVDTSSSAVLVDLSARIKGLNAATRINALAQCATPGVPNTNMSRSTQRMSLHASKLPAPAPAVDIRRQTLRTSFAPKGPASPFKETRSAKKKAVGAATPKAITSALVVSPVKTPSDENAHPNTPKRSSSQKKRKSLSKTPAAAVAALEDSFDQDQAAEAQSNMMRFHACVQAIKGLLAEYRTDVHDAGNALVKEALQRSSIGPQVLLVYPAVLSNAWDNHATAFTASLSDKKSIALLPVFAASPLWTAEWVNGAAQLVMTATYALRTGDMDSALSSVAAPSEDKFFQKALHVTATARKAPKPAQPTISDASLQTLRDGIEAGDRLLKISNSLGFVRMAAVQSERLDLEVYLDEGLMVRASYRLNDKAIVASQLQVVSKSSSKRPAERDVAAAFLDGAHLMEVKHRHFNLRTALAQVKTLSELPQLVHKTTAQVVALRKAMPALLKVPAAQLAAPAFDWSTVIAL